MSILPTSGVAVSAAGSHLAQVSGHQASRAQQAASEQQARLESQRRAEDTAGIAATDGEDQQAHDRDADGRLPWHLGGQQGESQDDANAEDAAATDAAESIAPADQASGSHLDLTG